MTFMSPSAPALSAPASPLSGWVSALTAAFSNFLRMRRGLAELRALSPDMLKDIGIERSDIDRYARYGR